MGCGSCQGHEKPCKHAAITWQLGIRAENPFTRGSHGWRAKMLGCIEIQSQKYATTKSAISQMSIICWYLLVHCFNKSAWNENGSLHHLVLTGGHVGFVRLPGPLGGRSPQRLHLLLFKAWLQPAMYIYASLRTGYAVECRAFEVVTLEV